MAHTCPRCGMKCHCRGDIDDLVFGTDQMCICCEDVGDWEFDIDDEELEAKPHRQELAGTYYMITDPKEGQEEVKQPEDQQPEAPQAEQLPDNEEGNTEG